MITARDRVLEQICHNETIPLPYVLEVEEQVARALDRYYGTARWREWIKNSIEHLPLPHPDLGIGGWSDPHPHTDLFGAVWRTNGTLTHLEQPPLREPTLAGFRFPTVDECFTPDWEEQVLSQMRANDDRRFVLCGIGFGVFERAWTLRGFENAMSDAVLEPAFYRDLVEAITDHQMQILERVLRLPFDGVIFSDDWGYQDGVILGPKRWRELIKPCYERLYQRVHRAGMYTFNHCCGSIVEILPDLIDIGLDVYESVQPEARGNNPYELKRRFGSAMTFFGGFGAQSMPRYTPEQAAAEVRRLRSAMRRGGGFILAPAKAIPAGTPVEVAAAVVEAFTQEDGFNPAFTIRSRAVDRSRV